MFKTKSIVSFISIIFFLVNLHSKESSTIFNDIKYTYAQQDLKEFLTIQALLSENRMNELVEFLDENFYVPFGEGENSGFQYIKNRNYINEIFPVIKIESGKNREGFVDNSLLIYFGFINNKNNSEWTYTNAKAKTILQLFRDSIEIGYAYTSFVQVVTNETINVENINRYTKKLIAKVDPSATQIIKASNFTVFPNWPDEIIFFGPGKTASTTIKINSIIGNDSGYLATISIKAYKLNDSNSEQPFNLQFFSALKNLNDRIWLDR